MRSTPRCALFQAEWPLQSHQENAVRCLVGAGIAVDLFVSQCDSYVDLGALTRLPGVSLFDFTRMVERTWGEKPYESRLRRRLRASPRAARWLERFGPRWDLIRGSRDGLVPPVLDRASECVAPLTRCLIGVEKRGLVWAGRVAERLGLPLVYLNLELYVDDFVRDVLKQDVEFRRLRQAERHYHRRAVATIVQDEDRAARLFHDNGIASAASKVLHVPCGALGGIRDAESKWLHEQLGLPREQRLMLYFGQIHEQRYSLALAEAAQQFPPDWTLVLHGWGPSETFERVREIDRAARVRISRDLVPPDRIHDIVASATAGFALYAPTPWNDQLTACASEKMAYYAQCGVPFVAFDYPNYRKILDDTPWGELIDDVREIPAALGRIVANHAAMRQQAFRAFSRYYDFARRFEPVVAMIEGLTAAGADAVPEAGRSLSDLELRSAPESWNPPAWIRDI